MYSNAVFQSNAILRSYKFLANFLFILHIGLILNQEHKNYCGFFITTNTGKHKLFKILGIFCFINENQLIAVLY